MELQRGDKKLLGEAVSGFANAAGGTLVVGICTEKHEGVDRAAAFEEIEQVEQVAARYRSYVKDAAAPAVEGIAVRPVLSANGRGIIVISIPQGQARPHMSRAPDHHTYYRRVMDTFLPMEAYEVEEMMRLKTFPKLEFFTQLRQQGEESGIRKFALLFGLRNQSRVTAKFPYIEYLHESAGPRIAPYGLDDNGRSLWPQSTVASEGVLFAAGADQVIHPGQSLMVSKFHLYESYSPSRPSKWGITQLTDHETLKLRFNFGCEDLPQETAIAEFTKQQLHAFVRPEEYP